jgi:hypothetical protein
LSAKKGKISFHGDFNEMENSLSNQPTKYCRTWALFPSDPYGVKYVPILFGPKFEPFYG